MATQTLKMKIQFRRDTTANWIANKDVIPAAGEPCFDVDLGTLKIGDGVKTYEQLDAIGGDGSISVSADGSSIVLADGVFKLAGFDTADTGAQPRKTADGKLEWVVPSTETDEGLQTAVTTLQSDVAGLKTSVNTLNADENTEGSVLKIVKDEINAFATEINDTETIDTFKELVDYVANHGGEAATMAADIAALQALVGEDSVASQIDAAVKIDSVKVGGTLLDIIEKSVNIPIATTSALGVVKASDEITVAEDGTLGIGTIGFSKITQASDEVIVLDGGASV